MKDDVDRIMEVMDVAFDPVWGEAWNRRQIGDSLAMPNTHHRLIGSDGKPLSLHGADRQVAGFFLVRAAPGEEELLLIAVCPKLRGRGLGAKLLDLFTRDAVARGAERIFLEMRANNPAISLYRREGFVPIGRRSNYYRRGDGGFVDAVTFGRDL